MNHMVTEPQYKYDSGQSGHPPSLIRNMVMYLLGHLSRRLEGELIVYPWSGVRLSPSLGLLALSNMNISATSGPIITRFYLKHHWGGGKAVLCFRPDRIGTLVSMVTDS